MGTRENTFVAVVARQGAGSILVTQESRLRHRPPGLMASAMSGDHRSGPQKAGRPKAAVPARFGKPQRVQTEAGAAANTAWLYGRHAVRAALANPRRRLRRLVVLPEAADEIAAWLAAAQAKAPPDLRPEILPRAGFETLLPPGAVHQGVALSADPLPEPGIEDVLEKLGAPAPGERQVVLLLDQVTDPQNVGAVLRSAAAFGVSAVILPEHGAPPVTGSLAKAASGGLEWVDLVRVVNLSRAIEKLQEGDFWCAGLDSAARDDLAALAAGPLAPPCRVALVLGAEDTGLRRLTREHCDFLVRLPTRGPIASLNVSNAAAIALYEMARGMTGVP
jgi:23S rRNA (guanosine2251-2'-O)-methyltransferase